MKFNLINFSLNLSPLTNTKIIPGTSNEHLSAFDSVFN